MTILSPLRNPCAADICAKYAGLGSATVVFERHCPVPGGVNKFIIRPIEMRSDLQITETQAAIDIPNQATTIPSKQPGGFGVTGKISLGTGWCRPEVQAAFFNSSIERDAATDGAYRIVMDSRPESFDHWQVAIIPMLGSQPSPDRAIVFDYCILMAENLTTNYSPGTPKDASLTFMAEPHPENGQMGQRVFGFPDVISALLTEPEPFEI